MNKIIFVCMFLAVSVFADTQSGMEKKVRLLVNDKEISGVIPTFSESVIDSLLNTAQYELVDLTWCLNYEQSITLTPGTTYYTLDTDVFVPFRVKVGTIALSAIPIKTLDADYPNWENDSGTPARYFIKIPTQTTNMVIGFHPITDATRTAYVNYVEIPDEMTSDSDVPFNSRRRLYAYHYLLVLRVASILSYQRGYAALAKNFMEEYAWRLKSMEETIRMKPGEIPSFIYSPVRRPTSAQ